METTAALADGQARPDERTDNVQALPKVAWALSYARRGWHVFPLPARSKVPAKGFYWQSEATVDEATIRSWWDEFPDDEVAIACGARSNVFVVDLDSPAAEEAFDELCRRHKFDGQPGVVRTSKGSHRYFQHVDGLRGNIKTQGERIGLPDTDTRGEGNYVVTSPSLHRSGHVYGWTFLPDTLPVPPPWLVEAFRSDDVSAKPPAIEHAERPPSRVLTREDLERYATYADRDPKLVLAARAARLIAEGKSWGRPNVDREQAFFQLVGQGSLESWFYMNHRCMIDRAELGVFDASCAAVNAEGVVRRTNRDYVVEYLDKCQGWKHGMDVLAERAKEEPLNLEDAFPTPPPRIKVPYTPVQEHKMIEGAVAALATDDTLFQRQRKLVTVSNDPSNPDGGARIFPVGDVRERLSRIASFVSERIDKTTGERTEEDVTIPASVPLQIQARGHWPGIRPLAGLLQTPTLRSDGSLLSAPGYDAATCMYLARTLLGLNVPDAPTHEDAVSARDVLLDLVCDFPFASEADRSVWLAAVLTRAARRAIPGPTPMFVADAPRRGTGKTILWEVACAVTTGADQPTTTWKSNEEELSKRLLAEAIRGAEVVFFDNVPQNQKVGGGALEMAVTSRVIIDRVLGATEMAEGSLDVTWLASGNNLRVSDDMSRRTLWCRLDANCPDPENRSGFKYTDVRAHVRANHAFYLSAALTLLRAYMLAGKPHVGARRLGSFEAWSELVGGAVVWVGLLDPVTTQDRAKTEAPDDVEAARTALLQAVWELQKDRHPEGLFARDLGAHDVYPLFRDAAEAAVIGKGPEGALTAKQIGELLKQARGTGLEVDGRYLKLSGKSDRKGVMRWTLREAA